MPDARAGSHAIVIGASIAGLLAASALSESFDRVTVYDRDDLPDKPEPRKGVPQSRHSHGLHASGASAMNELLPGFFDEMVAAGGIPGDVQLGFNWYLDGYRVRPGASGLTGIGLTRRLIERLIRARVESLRTVRIIDRSAVDGLTAADGRVTGVLVRGESGPVAADLVVDASGRGSRASAWLGDHGYAAPEESAVRTNVMYVTRHYRASPGLLDGGAGAVIAPYPGERRGAAVIRQEESQFVVGLVGILGVEPPTDDDGMLAFASDLAGPEAATVMRESEPLDEPVKMRFPASVRHHYEQMRRRPDRFIVTGDALCSFNPVYGQGMTIAALEARALRAAVTSHGLPQLPRRFYDAAGKLVDRAWALAVGADLSFPEVEGKRPPASGMVNSYLHQYRRAASVDPALGTAFLRVANMTEPPTSLLRPANILRVLRSARKARPGGRQCLAG
jgi:2-polyprenyl-6-methoxyphenol hydroxylase-like FAD-dependent oxidoreductase